MDTGGYGAVRKTQKTVKIISQAPAEGAKTGVADYAAALGPALREFDGDGEAVHLYHLGNNRLHERIYHEALATRGVVVLHDAVMHHFLLGTLDERQYLAEWIFNYGEWHRELGEDLWRSRGNSGSDLRYFRYPMLRRVIAASKGVIVHNRGAEAMAREHGVEKIAVIPHFYAPPASPPHAAEAAAFRRQLGVEPDAVMFGIFGYLRETKRVMPSLSAFFRLQTSHPKAVLLLAGEAVSPDLARALELEARHPAVRRMGHLETRELDIAIAASDCCINLRYPGAGESSGIAIRAMGAGKAVILSDLPETADFPEATVLRVKPGASEPAELLAYMELMVRYPELRRETGARAAEHIRREHGLHAVAKRYAESVREMARLPESA